MTEKQEKENRDLKVTFRVTEKEFLKLNEIVKESNVKNKSTFIRELVYESLIRKEPNKKRVA